MKARLALLLTLCGACFRDPETVIADGGGTDAPAKDTSVLADLVVTPDSPADPGDIPAAGDVTDAPAAGDVTDAPAAGDVTDAPAAGDVTDAAKPTDASPDGSADDATMADATAVDVIADGAPAFDVTNLRDAMVSAEAAMPDVPLRPRRGSALELNGGAAAMQSPSYRLSLEVRVDTLPEGLTSAAARRLRPGTRTLP